MPALETKNNTAASKQFKGVLVFEKLAKSKDKTRQMELQVEVEKWQFNTRKLEVKMERKKHKTEHEKSKIELLRLKLKLRREHAKPKHSTNAPISFPSLGGVSSHSQTPLTSVGGLELGMDDDSTVNSM